MTWIVEPLELRDPVTRAPSGRWHLVAHSDAGGGFHPCCDHEHWTATAASACPDARAEADRVTGLPTPAAPRCRCPDHTHDHGATR